MDAVTTYRAYVDPFLAKAPRYSTDLNWIPDLFIVFQQSRSLTQLSGVELLGYLCRDTQPWQFATDPQYQQDDTHRASKPHELHH